jgi:hypothetical protein
MFKTYAAIPVYFSGYFFSFKNYFSTSTWNKNLFSIIVTL